VLPLFLGAGGRLGDVGRGHGDSLQGTVGWDSGGRRRAGTQRGDGAEIFEHLLDLACVHVLEVTGFELRVEQLAGLKLVEIVTLFEGIGKITGINFKVIEVTFHQVGGLVKGGQGKGGSRIEGDNGKGNGGCSVNHVEIDVDGIKCRGKVISFLALTK